MTSASTITRIDSRLAWFARAAARHVLVEAGALDLGEAFDDLVAALVAIMPGALTDDQMVARWERSHPYRGLR